MASERFSMIRGEVCAGMRLACWVMVLTLSIVVTAASQNLPETRREQGNSTGDENTSAAKTKAVVNDFDGDGRSDVAIWRPSEGNWYIVPSSNPSVPIVRQWGTAGDIPVPGDYDGDGKTDIAVFRPSTGAWFILPSSKPGTYIITQWGTQGDIPVPGDYDGDGKADMAVFRPSTGAWFILPSSKPGTFIIQQWGTAGDVPVVGDYDGDGKADMAVFRPSTGAWFILPSSKPGTYISQQWGTAGDIPVPGDYDGDGKTDFAVWRPSEGNWYIVPSSNPSVPIVRQWGTQGDIPIPGDYDGDGKTDIEVWRPSIGTWFLLNSTTPSTSATTQWGVLNDVPVGESPATTLTENPLTVQVSVVANDPTGRALSYQWRSTDGTILNVNAPTTTWTLPDGPGAHFAYVLVSNGVGGYTERRILVNTDTIGNPLIIAAPKSFIPPVPALYNPNQPTNFANTFRGFVTGGRLTNVASFPGVGTTWNPPIPVSLPDVPVFITDQTTGARFPTTSCAAPAGVPCFVSTDIRGQFTIPNVPSGTLFFNGFSANCNLNEICGQFPPSTSFFGSFETATGISAYFTPFDIYANPPNIPTTISNVAGEILLQDGSPCGIADEFFGVEVVASASLLNASGSILTGPLQANEWGDYALPLLPGAAAVQLTCENAAPVVIPIPVGATGTIQLTTQTFASAPPVVSNMTATLHGTQLASPVAVFLPPASQVPSDVVPLGDAFLAEKGLDSRIGACQYYKAVGAVQSCDGQGNFTGAITFNDWMSQVQIDQYAVAAPTNPGATGVSTATYINKVDLNITRNHHSVVNGLPNSNLLGEAPYTYVATYVCNHLGPKELDAPQEEIDSLITSTINGQNEIACVTMDLSTFPVPFAAGGNVGYGPYIRFLIFGPNGQLLPSINLDTRREKFVPGTCVVCHGGDHYAGKFPEDGSAFPDVGGHFLPYDTGNFEFSSQPGLTQADQEPAIFNLNQNIMFVGTGTTAAEERLILGWYTQATGFAPPINQSYVDPTWVGQPLQNGIDPAKVYLQINARSCRTCHVALQGNYNFEQYPNFGMAKGIVDPGNCSLPSTPTDGSGSNRNRMYKMPNSLVTFNRFWESFAGNLINPISNPPNQAEPDQVSLFDQYFACAPNSPHNPAYKPASSGGQLNQERNFDAIFDAVKPFLEKVPQSHPATKSTKKATQRQ